jgi:hypothetical protein
MNSPLRTEIPPIETADLVRGLEATLGDHFGSPQPIVQLIRRPSPYQSSFPLEELDVELAGGAWLALMFKDLSWSRVSPAVQLVKRAGAYDPRREIASYRCVLQPMEAGAPKFYGAWIDVEAGRYWLFLERVVGRELYQVGELELWQEAARWLARFHPRAGEIACSPGLGVEAPWRQYDREFYWRWMRRAVRFSSMNDAAAPGQVELLAAVADRYQAVVAELLTMPITFIHGEFYASNVMVRDAPTQSRLCPIDWEMAALGPGLIDLAALTAGAWSEADRASIALAYYAEWPEAQRARCSVDCFRRDLDLCRLHLAIQWLGWSPRWDPPADHRFDWLSDLQHTVERLGGIL